MKVQGINRVVIVVKDTDKAVALYSKLLNTTFKYDPVQTLGVKAALSFDAGIEIVSPLPGANTDMAAQLNGFIQARGEGLFCVIFSVDNVEEARAGAEKMGVHVVGELKFSPEELKQHGLDDGVKTFVEYILNPADTCGAPVVLGQFK